MYESLFRELNFEKGLLIQRYTGVEIHDDYFHLHDVLTELERRINFSLVDITRENFGRMVRRQIISDTLKRDA